MKDRPSFNELGAVFVSECIIWGMDKELELIPSDVLMRRLLHGAKDFLSPDELSASVNGQVSPAEAIIMVREFLESRDVYTYIEQQKLMLYKAMDFISSMEQDAIDIGESNARNTYLNGLRFVSETLEKTSTSLISKESSLNQRNAQIMVDAIELAMHRALDALRQKHPTVSELEIREALQGALPSAVAEVGKYTNNE